MKKDSDSRSSGGSCFPATKENKTTHYAAYFTTDLHFDRNGREGFWPNTCK